VMGRRSIKRRGANIQVRAGIRMTTLVLASFWLILGEWIFGLNFKMSHAAGVVRTLRPRLGTQSGLAGRCTWTTNTGATLHVNTQ